MVSMPVPLACERDGRQQTGVGRQVLVRDAQGGVAEDARVSHAWRVRVLTHGIFDPQGRCSPSLRPACCRWRRCRVGVRVHVQAMAVGFRARHPSRASVVGAVLIVVGDAASRVTRVLDVELEVTDGVRHVVLNADAYVVCRARRHRRFAVDRVAPAAQFVTWRSLRFRWIGLGVDVQLGGVSVPATCTRGRTSRGCSHPSPGRTRSAERVLPLPPLSPRAF